MHAKFPAHLILFYFIILISPGQLMRYIYGLRAGRPGFDFRQVQEIFLFSPQPPLRLWVSPSLVYKDYWDSVSRGKFAAAWS
jgi:hypothetical protein